MAVVFLRRANPHLNTEVHTTVFYAAGVAGGHVNESGELHQLLEVVGGNLGKQIIVLATDSIRFGNKAEHVKALDDQLNRMHRSARLMTLRNWEIDTVKVALIEEELLTKYSEISKTYSKQDAGKSLKISLKKQEETRSNL